MKNKVELEKFIEEFALRHPDGMISFPAKILFFINGHPKVRYSEVQIITSADLNTIYFLNNSFQPEDLPDIFKAPDEEFFHNNATGLTIRKVHSEDYIEISPIL